MTDMIAADYGIRQLHARFADAVWRQDGEDFAGCFARNGEWKIAGLHFAGRDAIREAAGQLLGRCRRIHLVTGQAQLASDGDAVIGRLPMTEYAWMPDDTQYMTIGHYHDRYVEEDGAWRFDRRFWSLKYRGLADLSPSLVDMSEYGAFPAGPGPDDTTFVKRN
jgi:uncharacterized protein (TIGR02246 family)